MSAKELDDALVVRAMGVVTAARMYGAVLRGLDQSHPFGRCRASDNLRHAEVMLQEALGEYLSEAEMEGEKH